jgi:hypothetical protein
MAKLLTAGNGGSNVLGASNDLSTRIIRLRDDMKSGGAWTPGAWEINSFNASPVSGMKPGGQTSVEWIFPQGEPKKVERLLLRFDVVNAHATDTLATAHPLCFVQGLRLFVNGAEIHHYQSSLQLRILMSEYLQKMARREDLYARISGMRRSAVDQGTLTGESYAPASAPGQGVIIDVLALFPFLSNLVVSHPNGRFRSLKMELTFQASVGSLLDGVNFRNLTANAPLYTTANVTFNSVKLEAWTTEVVCQALLAQPAALLPVIKFQATSYDMDLTSVATTKVVRLAVDLPRSTLTFRTYVVLQEIAAIATYNDADAGGILLNGPDWVRLKFKKTGAVVENDLTGAVDARSFQVLQWEMSNGHAPPMEIYDGSGNLPETWVPGLALDWRLIDNDAAHQGAERTEIIGGLDLERVDYTLTINAAVPLSANVRLWVLNAYYELYSVADDARVSRLRAA